jgi:hypothetical protein
MLRGPLFLALEVSRAAPRDAHNPIFSIFAGGPPSGNARFGSEPWSLLDVALPVSAGRALNVRYVDQIYAQRRPECWANGAYYWNDCGPAAAAMVLHYEGRETRDVLSNRRATLDLVCEAKPGCWGTTNRDRIVATLTAHGLEALVASIDGGHPVILSLTPRPDHVRVVIGYEPGGNVVVQDPYGGAFW